MSPPLWKLSRETLREIAMRRRDDPDVKALLWEIKRLHEVMADTYDLVFPLPKAQLGVQELATWKRLAAEMLASRVIVRQREPQRDRRDPALPDTRPLRRWKPERARPTENEGERGAKRRARQERR